MDIDMPLCYYFNISGPSSHLLIAAELVSLSLRLMVATLFILPLSCAGSAGGGSRSRLHVERGRRLLNSDQYWGILVKRGGGSWERLQGNDGLQIVAFTQAVAVDLAKKELKKAPEVHLRVLLLDD